MASQKESAEQTARINAQALAMKKKKLGKLGVGPNDPLLQVPVGPGPSNAEVRNIRKSLVYQPKQRKLGDDDESVVLADAAEYAAGVAVSSLFSISAWLTWVYRLASASIALGGRRNVCPGTAEHALRATAERSGALSFGKERSRPRSSWTRTRR
jgi:hypothetical protein